MFPYCKESKDESQDVLALLSFLQSNPSSPEPQGPQNPQNPTVEPPCPSQWRFQNVYLANKITEAPGSTGEGFKDSRKAINGICGCGKLCGSLDVYSLQSSATTDYCEPNEKCVVLEWEGKKVKNTQGIDFVVFENGFCYNSESNCGVSHFMEPMFVEVSVDGNAWCGWNPQYIGDNTQASLTNPNNWLRFAGVEPVVFHQEKWQLSEQDIFDKTKAGGDGFDLLDPNFGNSGENCTTTLKSQIQSDGFVYLRLTFVGSRGFSVHNSFDGTADVDGVVAREVGTR